MKVLVLNPPFKRMLIRDYCCSHTSKANYCWVPIDMLVLSGVLSEKYDVDVLDSIVMKYGQEETLKKIEKINPDVLISMVSAIAIKSDMKFLSEAKKATNSKLFVIGDIAYFRPEHILKEYSDIDGIIFDFSTKSILELINGKHPEEEVAYRKFGKIYIGDKTNKCISYSIPKHEKFPLKKYSMPYSMHSPNTTILTTYGCPYFCTFCPSGKLQYKVRDLDNIIEEMKYIEKLGIKEIFIRDFTFTGNKRMVRDFCNALIKNKMKIKWSCSGRVDNVDPCLLRLMKDAGCYLIAFGIESASDEILKEVRKGTDTETMKYAINLCNRVGIKTLGSFIIGLPDDTKESILRTIEFSKELKLNYASFNMFVPRYGTDIRDELESKDFKSMDSSVEVESICGIPEDELIKLHKKAIREFYFRPGFIVNSILGIRTLTQLRNLVKNGLNILVR